MKLHGDITCISTWAGLVYPAAVVAILVFFVHALQCMSTAGPTRRETGTWKWPAIARTYMLITTWAMAAVAHALVAVFI